MEEQLEAGGGGSLGGGFEAPSNPGTGSADARCVHCGEGMSRDVLPRFSRVYGITVLVVGLLLSAFMSLLLGLPMVIIGAYMGAANRAVWMCQACGAMVDRIGS